MSDEFYPGKVIFCPEPTDDPTQMDAEALGLNSDFLRLDGNDDNYERRMMRNMTKATIDAMAEIKAEKEKTKRETVNHPPHYNNLPAKCECGEQIECIQVVEHMPFCEGNAVKYLWRCGLKDGVSKLDDLRKSLWYINRAIEKEIEAQNGK